ncbi:metal-dependent hydrolase [Kosmotoga arenicorallina S304]|uniref:Metal-dependent hydrolase n=1 Tax=Kosmotoga arenicorallina S304 TaxID=1453497 RepID=A0A176K269_9BACT|nr:SprT family zinc-dependent metalloprotease [Kosmotoga arenicorallina]OAA31161.1 metal-dependent hydrolase [Kosmotoga arenicorallina S304]
MDIKIDKIVRTKRKTIALQITDDATLVVRAPFYVSDETIKRVVLRHKKWIERKKSEIQKRDPKFSKKEFVNGEGFLYLGKSFKLAIVDGQEVPLKLDDVFSLSKKYLPDAKQIFIKWYWQKAYEKISERVNLYAQRFGYMYNKVRITNAQKRWGSCSSKGNLNFSWRLVMAPLPVIDYVVIHELVHLEVKNHSREFWHKVKMLMPDYALHRLWLRENGYMLRL